MMEHNMEHRTPEQIAARRIKANERTKKNYRKNPEPTLVRGRAWYQANKGPELRAKRAAYDKNRYHTNPVFRLAKCMRVRLKAALGRKKSKTEVLVGCDFQFLKDYLEYQFKDGMSWNNYGKWEVDHIIPLASAKDVEEVKRLCHYTNLQPLWSLDNKKKLKKVG